MFGFILTLHHELVTTRLRPLNVVPVYSPAWTPNLGTLASLHLGILLPSGSSTQNWLSACSEEPDGAPESAFQTSNLTWLSVKFRASSVSEVLEYAFHTKILRQLDIYVNGAGYVQTHALLCSAASTLARIEIHYHSAFDPVHLLHIPLIHFSAPPFFPLPLLPALRRVKLMARIEHYSKWWIKDVILTILNSDPAPRSPRLHSPSQVRRPNHLLEHEQMIALDDALMSHLAGPSLLWRLARYSLSDFRAWIQGEMLKVHGKERLLVAADI
ncbi:hypothetical protein B0H19DRAFT_1264779 [Mycena capillaripes]|nr:hypothetical protein B0H19DRAFT_1264779 [Mycena capillaripes]